MKLCSHQQEYEVRESVDKNFAACSHPSDIHD
jgi:hypothetical protein